LLKAVAMMLAIAMLFAIPAFATDAEEEPAPTGTTKSDENNVMTIYGYNGATAVLAQDEDEFFKLTYTNGSLVEGNQYLLIVMAYDEEDGDIPDPTGSNILYIDQQAATADGLVFEKIYPMNPADSIIVIYGLDAEKNSVSLEAAVIRAAYILGDANRDGVFDVMDAIAILRVVAGLSTMQDIDQAAANVDGEAGVDVMDAIKMLRVIAKLEESL